MKSSLKLPFAQIVVVLVLICLGLIPFLHFATPFNRAASLTGYELTSALGDARIFSAARSIWIKAERGYVIHPNDILQTGPDAEAEFQIPDMVRFRVKPDSELSFPDKRGLQTKEPAYCLNLDKGTLLTVTEGKELPNPVEIASSALTAVLEDGALAFEVHKDTGLSAAGLMRGNAGIYTSPSSAAQVLYPMQKAVASPTVKQAQPEKISNQDWQKYHEVYEIIPKTAASEAHQLDLSKKAGNLFDFVFDHGTFFTPQVGFADREFMEDPDHADQIFLQTEYDVFPTGSFVGVYIKTRDLDISKFQALRFEARRVPGETAYPESFKIELKSKSGVARAFTARHFERNWTVYDFPLNFTKPEMLREIAFVFSNDRVGTYTKGFLQMRHFTLVAAPEPPAAAPAAEPAPAAAAAPV